MTRLALIALALLGVSAGGALAGGPSAGTANALTAGSVRFVASTGDGTTLLKANGRFERLDGNWGFPRASFAGPTEGLSRDGRTLVLATRTDGPLASPSRFVVVDPRTLRLRKLVSLPGHFAYDAMSPDARKLYLIEYVTVVGELRYRVRSYDLAANRLDRRVIADKRSHWTTMEGLPYSRATTRDGSWVYTLYGSDTKSFVHALNARKGYAVCIDLPQALIVDGLRLRLGNGRLRLVDAIGAEVAAIDTASLRVLPNR